MYLTSFLSHQNHSGMLGRINFWWTQISRKQLIPTENIQRQKAIVVIIAMKKAIFLHPVSEIIGGLEIKNQLSRRRGETFDKEFDNNRLKSTQARRSIPFSNRHKVLGVASWRSRPTTVWISGSFRNSWWALRSSWPATNPKTRWRSMPDSNVQLFRAVEYQKNPAVYRRAESNWVYGRIL